DGAGDEVVVGAGLPEDDEGVVVLRGLTYRWSPAEVLEPAALAEPLSITASAAATGSMWSSRRTFAIFSQGGRVAAMALRLGAAQTSFRNFHKSVLLAQMRARVVLLPGRETPRRPPRL